MPQQCPEHLILFTRYPEAGTTKTRLIPALGPEGAARAQRLMTERMIDELEALRCRRQVVVEVRHAGGDSGRVRNWLGSVGRCRPQPDGDLGHRLHAAFTAAFNEGSCRVLVLGSDCPSLSATILGQALDALDDHDLVLGPALDGGYYLIGLCQPQPELFADMEWGNGSVLARTRERAHSLGLRVALLESLADVDRPEDLAHLGHHPCP